MQLWEESEMTDIEYIPQPAKETAWQRLLLALGLSKRNARDERQAKAAAENARLRGEGK